MTLEDETRTEAEAWAAAQEYAPGDLGTQDDFATGWLTALRRDPSPEEIEAAARAIRDFNYPEPEKREMFPVKDYLGDARAALLAARDVRNTK